jgi:uncharacterized protein YjbI with pentapeptide repeats
MDLSNAVLNNVTAEGVWLNDCVLRGASLRNADLYWAHCFRADFTGAELEGAD